jgi:uncharacterized membrane protein
VIVGVTNHEAAPVDYRVTIDVPGEPARDVAIPTMADGKTWQEPVSFSVGSSLGRQTVQFLLYKGSSTAPYRRLHLMLDIGTTPTPAP